MIQNYDRKYWLGCSDTRFVMAKNRSTVTWIRWWNIKIGADDSLFSGNVYTRMGTLYEHPILKTIDESMNLDRQLKIPKYNLRANLDGDLDGVIYEVKTHREDTDFDVKRGSIYYNQCQVEMFAWKKYYKDSQVCQDYHTRQHIPEFKELYIVEYPLKVDEYNKLPLYESGAIPVEIDEKRIKLHRIKYDRGFISEYKQRAKELAKKIREGSAPF